MPSIRSPRRAPPPPKLAALKSLLERATALEAKYILKIITGELRIGLKESLVEEAIAKAYDEPLGHVQRANMLLGDIGGTLRLAAEHRLDEARMRLFHPIGFMLASPAADADEAFQYFEHAQVEDKYDGIRAQAHCGGGQVRLFSRTLDEVTPSFPELIAPLSEFAGEVILDGEIVAWRIREDGGHAMPFSEIQKRLGRKQVSEKLIAEVPVAYVVFDVIYAGGELDSFDNRPLLASADAQFWTASSPERARVAPRPVVNAQGNLLFEPEIRGSSCRVGMGAARSGDAGRFGRATGAILRAGHGARQRRADDQGPASRPTCRDAADAGG